MKITYLQQRPVNLNLILRKMGYHPIMDKRAMKESWVRTLSQSFYPRFHLYIKNTDARTIILDIHLDQKQHTIELAGVSRHAGEYDSPRVEEEAGRIQRWLQYINSGGKI